jgi:glyoxylase-like metal-dependent hydrolase (beta-lactamase superfamily II)
MFNARKSPPADEVTEDGASIWVGSHEWQVLHTPGHTPGGICLYNAAQSMCLTGDTLFVGSVGRIDGPKASGAQLLNSIRTKLLVLPDDTTIFPGHNYGITPSSSIGIERVENPFVNGQWDLDEF